MGIQFFYEEHLLLGVLCSKICQDYFRSVKIRTRGCFMRNRNSTSVLCSPPTNATQHRMQKKKLADTNSSSFCKKRIPQRSNSVWHHLPRISLFICSHCLYYGPKILLQLASLLLALKKGNSFLRDLCS